MKAKEKARELYRNFYDKYHIIFSLEIRRLFSKQNATYFVDEIIKELEKIYEKGWVNPSPDNIGERTKYYLDVKDEIEKIK